MSTTTLNTADRAAINTMAQVMMDMNNRNDDNAWQGPVHGTYGHLHKAIVAFVFNQTGVSIENESWNLGGNETWADDIQYAIDNKVAQDNPLPLAPSTTDLA